MQPRDNTSDAQVLILNLTSQELFTLGAIAFNIHAPAPLPMMRYLFLSPWELFSSSYPLPHQNSENVIYGRGGVNLKWHDPWKLFCHS